MAQSSRRNADNPIIGILHCECGKVMKVRRRAVGRPGKCGGCGRVMYADSAHIQPRPKKGEFVPGPAAAGSEPGAAEIFTDPFAQAAADDWGDEQGTTEPVVISGPAAASSETAGARGEDEWVEETWDAGFGEADGATDPFQVDEDDPDDRGVEDVSDDARLDAVQAEPTPAPPSASPPASPDDEWVTGKSWDGASASTPAVESPSPVAAEPEEAAAPDANAIAMSPDVYVGSQGFQNAQDHLRDAAVESDAAASLPPEPTPPPQVSEEPAGDDVADDDADDAAERDTGLFDVSLEPGDSLPAALDAADSDDGTFDTPLDFSDPGFAEEPGPPDAAADSYDAPLRIAAADESGFQVDTELPPTPDAPDTVWDAVAPPTEPPQPAPRVTQPPPPSDGTSWDAVAPDDQYSGEIPEDADVVPATPVPRMPTPLPRRPTPTPAAKSNVADKSYEAGFESFDSDSRDLGRGPERDLEGRRGTSPRGSQAALRGAGVLGTVGKHRPPWAVPLLSVITLSIYYLVWVHKVAGELRDHLVRRKPLSPGLAVGLHLVPVFGLGWMHFVLYRLAADLNEVQHLEGHEPALAAGGIALMSVSANLVGVLGLVLLVQAPMIGMIAMVGGVLLWCACVATVQSALNAHWALH